MSGAARSGNPRTAQCTTVADRLDAHVKQPTAPGGAYGHLGDDGADSDASHRQRVPPHTSAASRLSYPRLLHTMRSNDDLPLQSRTGGTWIMPAMHDSATSYTGPLGSTVHVLRADAGTIAELAAIDWSRHFRRVCLDPVRRLITLMAPSHLHEDLSETLGHIVDAAGSVVAGATKGIRSTRLRGQSEPPETGMEPDCAFYVGDRARDFRDALLEGETAAAFVERIAPDLVVEVEITHADEGKAEWGCGSCGGCTGARGRGRFGRSSSPCIRGVRRTGSMPRRYSEGSPRRMCARRWRECGPA